MKKVKIAIVVAASVLLTGIGATIAWASIPDSSGVIHACYQSPPPAHGANLQVIDTGAGGSCGGGMVALNWNQTGPQGPAGPPGLAGVHIVTVVVTTSQRVQCPTGETALGIAFSQSGQVFSKTYSTVPVFAADGVTPIGYDVDASAATSSAHLTCATTS